MTLDEYFEQTPELRLLEENLKANLDGTTDLTDAEKEMVMRVNKIVIRQYLETWGRRG